MTPLNAKGGIWLGVWLRQNVKGLQPWTAPRKLTFRQVLNLLEPAHDGVFYRHPKQRKFNNPRSKEYGFSRDQMIPLVAAMGVWGMHADIRRMWNALPEDVFGKHAFNGNYRNLLGQDGQDCDAIKKRGCDATADCSLKVDDRSCSLNADTRDCSLQEDRRSCGHDQEVCVPTPLPWDLGRRECRTVHVNDPICEGAKAAQNVAYKASKDACEVAKATQNEVYRKDEQSRELAKAVQNGIYKADKDSCELAKAGGKGACELNKAADQLLCRATNVHSGDLIFPMTVNLFRRAIGENPLNPASSLYIPPANLDGGLIGETNLWADARMPKPAAAADVEQGRRRR